MRPSDGGSVLILGAGFDGLAEKRATCIGVNGFMNERTIDISV